MTVILMPDVRHTFTEISDFIDSVNLKGAGERWVDRFLGVIDDFSKSSGYVKPPLWSKLSASILKCGKFSTYRKYPQIQIS